MGRGLPKLLLIRLLATILDVLLGMVLGLLLSNSAIGSFFAGRAVVMLRIGSADTLWKGPVPMMLGILGTFVYVLPLAILLILLTEPLAGTSPGKIVFGLEIVPSGQAILSRKQLWCRSAVKTIFFWGLVVALLLGNWILAVCFTVLGLALLCNVALSLFFPLSPIHQSLSWTRVAHQRAQRQQRDPERWDCSESRPNRG
jgi:hypothetical protein